MHYHPLSIWRGITRDGCCNGEHKVAVHCETTANLYRWRYFFSHGFAIQFIMALSTAKFMQWTQRIRCLRNGAPQSFKAALQGFHVPSWASGSVDENYFPFLGGTYSLHAMVCTMSLSSSSPTFAAVRDTVPMQNGEWYANSLSFMVYLPPDMPAHGVVKFFVSGGTGDSIAVVDTIGSQVTTGRWSTLWLTKLDSLKSLGKFDPGTPKTIGVAIYYPAPYDTTSWTGNVEFKDLWIYGLSFPNGLVDGVKELGEAPKSFQLNNNYPNPFNPTTTISYQIPSATGGRVTLKVYDTLGREVALLVNEKQAAGTHAVTFDGSRLASGVYFYRLATGSFVDTKKLVLIK